MTNIVEALCAEDPTLSEVVVPAFSEVYHRLQPAGNRKFVVSGPKADAVRVLIFADRKLTRKAIATLCGCSVSRVGEVVWGLEQDAISFPNIPLR